MKYLCKLLCISFIILLGSCQYFRYPATKWPYAKDAIHFTFYTSSSLNIVKSDSHSSASHPLMVCIYQLNDSKEFDRLSSSSQEGLYQLLECNRFGDSVTHAESFYFQPEKRKTDIYMDRKEHTKKIAIVAGYNDPYTKMKEEHRKITELIDVIGYHFFPSKEIEPIPMRLHIKLGPEQIEKIEVK